MGVPKLGVDPLPLQVEGLPMMTRSSLQIPPRGTDTGPEAFSLVTWRSSCSFGYTGDLPLSSWFSVRIVPHYVFVGGDEFHFLLLHHLVSPPVVQQY